MTKRVLRGSCQVWMVVELTALRRPLPSRGQACESCIAPPRARQEEGVAAVQAEAARLVDDEGVVAQRFGEPQHAASSRLSTNSSSARMGRSRLIVSTAPSTRRIRAFHMIVAKARRSFANLAPWSKKRLSIECTRGTLRARSCPPQGRPLDQRLQRQSAVALLLRSSRTNWH